MDIRSIIDAEDAPAVRQSSIPNPTFRDSKPLRNDERNLDSSQSQHFSERHDPRPSQPPPLQTPGFRNGRSHQESQQVFVHSPYQQTNPFDAHNGSLPFPQNQSLRSPIGSQPGQYSQRDDRSMSSAPSHYAHGPSTPLTYTPSASTPGSASAYSSWPRPTSSHSIPTPNSAQYPPPGLMRGSPQASHPQLRALPGPHSAQSYASQPNTPLGPPPLHTRPSLNSHRDSPVGYEHQRSLSNGSHGQFHAVAPSPTLVGSPLAYGSRQSHPSIHNISSLHERDRSLSVSPKTRLPDLPEREVFSIPEHARTPSSQTSSAIGKVRGDSLEEMKMHTMIRKPAPERSTSAGINGLLNAAPPDELKRRVTDHSQPSDTHYHQHLDSSSDEMRSVDSFLTRPVREQISNSTFISDSSSAQRSIAHNDESQVSNPQTPTQAASECSNLRVTSSISSNMAMSPATNQTKGPSIGSQMDLISEVDQIKPDNLQKLDPGVDQAIKSEDPASNLPAQPAKKKPRLEELQDRAIASQIIAEERVALQDASNHLPKPPKKRSRHMEIPIWAQSVKGPNRAATGNPLLRSKRPGFEPQNIQANNSGAAPVPIQPPTNPSSQIQTNGNSLPKAQPVLADSGPLGPWEPSILNIIPSEELVKTVSDFLFREIVLKQDIGVGPAGGAAGQGAVLEVEAKIGRLVDKDTNGRIQLPIATECVLSHSTPNLQWKFESTMTETQHRALNGYLNKALVSSQPSKPTAPNAKPVQSSRIPLTYKHTRETDTFYELSQTGLMALPQIIIGDANSRSAKRTKVRITTDQKSGEVLAKIVKVRLADIDIYSPRTPFDWRVSVNVEMDFKGDMRELIEPDKRPGKSGDRNKDRMSYKHLAYQIDLTQVTPSDPKADVSKEHELEIEVSSAEVRRQGMLAMEGKVSQYEELIRGFVDNVRILARACP